MDAMDKGRAEALRSTGAGWRDAALRKIVLKHENPCDAKSADPPRGENTLWCSRIRLGFS